MPASPLPFEWLGQNRRGRPRGAYWGAASLSPGHLSPCHGPVAPQHPARYNDVLAPCPAPTLAPPSPALLVYAVLFDIDGTLVQTGGAGQLAFGETFAAEFGVPVISPGVSFAGRSDRAIALDLMRHHDIASSEENWFRFRAAYLARLPNALKRRDGRVLPGVAALLDELASHQWPLVGLLTGNVRAGADHKLAYYGLENRFAFGGFGDDTDDRCEIAAIAQNEAQRFAATRNGGTSPELAGVMVIGDTVHDVRCARAIGAFAVAVPTGGSTRAELEAVEPDLLLDDLADSKPLLDVILATR